MVPLMLMRMRMLVLVLMLMLRLKRLAGCAALMFADCQQKIPRVLLHPSIFAHNPLYVCVKASIAVHNTVMPASIYLP